MGLPPYQCRVKASAIVQAVVSVALVVVMVAVADVWTLGTAGPQVLAR